MADKTPPDTPLDEAIDRAVREMMHVEPTGDLRQRVLDELAGRHWVMPWRALASASAALAAIVLLVVSLITRETAPPESRVATTRAGAAATQRTTPPPATKESIPGASPAVRRDALPIAQRPGRSTRPVAPPSAQERLVEAASIPGPLALDTSTTPAEPLAPVFPVAMTLLYTPPIRTSEIEITEITLERIEIVPLPSRR